MPVNDHESPFRVWRHLTTFISAVLFVLALADIPEQARKWRDGWIAVRGPLSGILDWITATLDGTAGRWILGVAALALMLLFSPLLDRPIEWVKKRYRARVGYSLSAGAYTARTSRQSGTAVVPPDRNSASVSISTVSPTSARIAWEPRAKFSARIVPSGTAVQFSRTKRNGWFLSRFGRPDVITYEIEEFPPTAGRM